VLLDGVGPDLRHLGSIRAVTIRTY
jgi:hypothetical protein